MIALRSLTLSICLVILLSGAATAVEYDIYFIGGQSNASGRGDTTQIPSGSPLASPQTDVQFYWHKTQTGVINGNLTQDTIIDLQPGSGHGTNSPSGHASEFGSELSFGRTLADAFPDRNTMIVKYSHGGSNLHTQWASGGSMYNTFLDTVDGALDALDFQGDTYNLMGMTWLQGESDTGGSNAGNYQNNLVNLIDRVRTDVFSGADAPFVLTRLSDNQYSSLGSGQNTVRAAQLNVPSLRANVATINTDDDLLFTTYSNGLIHFDANGQIGLGNALGQQMVSILNAVPEPTTSINIYNASPANATQIDNGFGSAGVNTLAGTTGALTVDSTWGNNHAFGLASTDTIDALATASSLGRALQETDKVTMTAVVSGITGDLHSNGFEFGLAPSVGFRPSPHLIFQVDADGAASGLAHFPNAGSPATSFWADATGTDDAVWGADEASVEDGFKITLEADRDGFTITVSDAIFNDNGSATPGVFSGTFSGAEFLDNFGSGHLYLTSQKAGDAMALSLSELSIDVSIPGLNGDFDEDGDVDGADFLSWQRGVSPNPVSATDLQLWQNAYGTDPSQLAAATSVPEPATLLMCSLGLLAGYFARVRT